MKKQTNQSTRLTVNAHKGQKAANTKKEYEVILEQIHFSTGHISLAAKSQRDAERLAKKIRGNEVVWQTTVHKINVVSMKAVKRMAGQ